MSGISAFISLGLIIVITYVYMIANILKEKSEKKIFWILFVLLLGNLGYAIKNFTEGKIFNGILWFVIYPIILVIIFYGVYLSEILLFWNAE